MKKILLFLLALILVGCVNPEESINKDKKLLNSSGLRYDQLVLRWEEPQTVKYLNTDKFIAVWKKDLGYGQNYDVRILFYNLRVISWKIDDSNIRTTLTDDIIYSLLN
jgi:hypothetical protein